MQKSLTLALLGAAMVLWLCSADLKAQETVFNGDFETASHSPMWTLLGGNDHTMIATFETVVGKKSLCLKRRPGKPNDNGAIEQEVYLIKDLTYQFHADIAAIESG